MRKDLGLGRVRDLAASVLVSEVYGSGEVSYDWIDALAMHGASMRSVIVSPSRLAEEAGRKLFRPSSVVLAPFWTVQAAHETIAIKHND